MTGKKEKVKININDIATGIYGYLMKDGLITPDEYHILNNEKIRDEEEKPKEEVADGNESPSN